MQREREKERECVSERERERERELKRDNVKEKGKRAKEHLTEGEIGGKKENGGKEKEREIQKMGDTEKDTQILIHLQ